jgi:glycosyltransferase involved in cell wall biosynthesis
MVYSISVIIPTLNESTLAATLEALTKQSRMPDEIIVVGLDGSAITADYPMVRFIDTSKPVCAAAARNRGILSSRGDVLLLTDADCIPAPDWVERHATAQQAGLKIVGGGVALDGSNYWAQSDNVSMFHDFVEQQPSGEKALLPTLNLSVHRSVIQTVGLLDESFPGAAAEDADWTIRMRLAGYTLKFEPGAVVRHAPARTQWSDVVTHWRSLGYSAIRVRQRYADELKTPGIAHSAFWLRLLSPLIAARITFGIYANPIFWRYLLALPVVYATKIIYCFGAAASIREGYASS